MDWRRHLEFVVLIMLVAGAIIGVDETGSLAAAQAASEVVVAGTNGPAGSMAGIAFNRAAPSSTWIFGASTADGKVFVMDAATSQTVYSFGFEKGIFTPDDVVVASNGDIYYTNTLAGFAGRIVLGANPPATTVSMPVNNPVTNFIPWANSIALSDDETHLYVGSCFAPPPFLNLIYDIDLTTGQVSPVTGLNGTPVSFPSCSLNGMKYRNGYLYGAQTVTGDILRIGPVDAPSQAVVVPIVAGALSQATCGSTPQFVNPSAVAFDSSGQLYVTDAYTNQLRLVANPNGVCQASTLVTTLPGSGGIASVAVDTNHNDRIYVSSTADGYIRNVSDNVFVKTSGLALPLGLAAVGGNRLYLGDFITLRTVDVRHDVVEESVTQTIQGFLDGTGVAAPFTVAPFGEHLVLADWLDQVIQVYDPDDQVAVASIVTRPLTTGYPPEPLGSPLNAIEYKKVSGQRTIVAAHFANGTAKSRLVRYSGQNFATVQVLASCSNCRFTGMASRGSKYWIADAIAGKIFEFDSNGIGAEVATGLVNPRGLAPWNGYLLVIEGAPAVRLTAVKISDGSKTVIETLPPLQPANPALSSSLVPGVTVDPDTHDVYFSAPGHVAPGDVASGSRTLRRISASEIEQLLR